jgi:hypothetical protein
MENPEENPMRNLTTILCAALIAGVSTVAMAQGGGAGGAGGDTNPDRMGKGSDANPSSPGATPRSGTTEAVTPGVRSTAPTGMTTAPASGSPQGTTQGGSSSTPSAAPTGTSK